MADLKIVYQVTPCRRAPRADGQIDVYLHVRTLIQELSQNGHRAHRQFISFTHFTNFMAYMANMASDFMAIYNPSHHGHHGHMDNSYNFSTSLTLWQYVGYGGNPTCQLMTRCTRFTRCTWTFHIIYPLHQSIELFFIFGHIQQSIHSFQTLYL
ncbi:MAG: hypothetical protein EZS28_030369 [Streblomastix strix]|uniref:Uncharacterized protein n=1 Tax=Streblomastix strix TaxID=222440 RepID=A0A5J4UU10_9EUKA|nr:MAG: hypothetical protein EZS28_030369 [Streblomastix strix]